MNGRLQSLKDDQSFYQLFISQAIERPWPYWFGGVLLALFNLIYVVVTGHYWGISNNLARWGAWVLERVGVNSSQWNVWSYYDYYAEPWLDRQTWSNLGIIIGALIGILLTQNFKWKRIKDKKQFIMVLAGGWLMGYGSRVAIGCNIGGLYSSISSLALNGWIYLPFAVIGVFFW